MSVAPPIEEIRAGDRVLGVILRAAYEPRSTEFLTSQDRSLQLGVMRRPRGHVIEPHTHKPVTRTVHSTCEAVFVAQGRVEVTFFDDARVAVATRALGQGDCVMLMSGGHGFRVLEDCKLIEVKQGPYAGRDFDKVKFKESPPLTRQREHH